MGSTRFDGAVALTILGALAVVGCLGAVGATIAVWTSTPVCFPESKPGVAACVRTGPASDLTHGPWTYAGVALGLFLLAVCLFTLRERIRTRD